MYNRTRDLRVAWFDKWADYHVASFLEVIHEITAAKKENNDAVRLTEVASNVQGKYRCACPRGFVADDKGRWFIGSWVS